MRRRQFMTFFGGAATSISWPLVARAQQEPMPVVGFLNGASPRSFAHVVAAFRQGLSATGYVEGRNVAIEFRWAEGQYDQMPAMAADLVGRRVAAIAVGGSPTTVLSAKVVPTTIPVVFVSGTDPVKAGLVSSLNRPGGHITGVYFFTRELESKRLGLLRELVPAAPTVVVLVNPTSAGAKIQTQEVQEAARALGLQIQILRASNERDLDAVFATLVQRRAGAVLVVGDPFFNSRRDQIVGLAARHAIPAMYEHREFTTAGGLASYGTSVTDAYRQAGGYVGRVLKGEKPADLPVIQSTRFELVINLKTAKGLGVIIPQPLLLRADEVIQ
jgi:putative ABC transport system substrate-binding protein